ncbi:MAG: hypothetical protein Q8O19_03920 [Rectinemataceae bacterium]|nr:hypothetical protein [Rectinemataceae bacterium]
MKDKLSNHTISDAYYELAGSLGRCWNLYAIYARFCPDHNGVLRMHTKIEKEILNQLRISEWMTVLELKDQIGAKRNLELGPRSIGMFISHFSPMWGEILADRSPSLAAIYIGLEILEEEGSIMNRYRDDPPEVLQRRGGQRRREWRLL